MSGDYERSLVVTGRFSQEAVAERECICAEIEAERKEKEGVAAAAVTDAARAAVDALRAEQVEREILAVPTEDEVYAKACASWADHIGRYLENAYAKGYRLRVPALGYTATSFEMDEVALWPAVSRRALEAVGRQLGFRVVEVHGSFLEIGTDDPPIIVLELVPHPPADAESEQAR